jgi:hypothetical protein
MAADLKELWAVMDRDGLTEAFENQREARAWCKVWNELPNTQSKPYSVQRFLRADGVALPLNTDSSTNPQRGNS